MKIKFIISLIVLFVFALTSCNNSAPPVAEEQDLSVHPVYSGYDFSNNDNVIDFGVQPLWLPTSIISEAMKRDSVLRNALSEQGLEIRFHSFFKGADVNYFIGQSKLEAGIGGDMPALTATATLDVKVTALIQHGFIAIVAKRYYLLDELRGKRIGFPFGSIAHFVILEALSGAGLNEQDVILIPLDVNEMPDALDKGEIDAFSAWEPTPTISMNRFKDQVVIYRSLTKGYLYFTSSFTEKYTEAVRQIVAAEIRAISWMQNRRQNLLMACEWAAKAGKDLSGSKLKLNVKQAAVLAEKDILGLMSNPVIPASDLNKKGSLYREFDFLRSLGKIPSSVQWEDISSNFHLNIVEEVINDPEKYFLKTYNYSSINSDEE